MQILSSAFSVGLFAFALWSAYAVIRTAVELRTELRTPVRVAPAQTSGLPIRAGRSVRR